VDESGLSSGRDTSDDSRHDKYATGEMSALAAIPREASSSTDTLYYSNTNTTIGYELKPKRTKYKTHIESKNK
jgi:hypothetical protein